MAKETAKKLSLGKRIAGFLAIGLVMIVSFVGTSIVIHYFSGSEQTTKPAESPEGPSLFGYIAFMFVGGFFLSGAGFTAYAATILTHCFTFNFNKPIWDSVKKKLYLMNIVVLVLTGAGAASFVSMIVMPVLTTLGFSWTISVSAPFLITFIAVGFLSMWINIWRPLELSIVKKRLAACGVSNEDIEKGICIGISDPAKSSFKKMTMVEEDIGMLWLRDNDLVYIGDTAGFNISRSQLVEVERVADAGSMSAYGGDVHVILRFKTNDGAQHRIRLHTEGHWTMGSRARASDDLEEKLVRWQQVFAS